MLSIFISYAIEDRRSVEPYYERLKNLGFHPWMDIHDLLPGQTWELEIARVINRCDVAILFASHVSITKRGFVQWEMRELVKKIRLAPEGDICVIPVQLEACNIPECLASLHWINLKSLDGWDKVRETLQHIDITRTQNFTDGTSHGEFRIYEREIIEEWDGIPGYEAELKFPELIHHNRKIYEEINLICRSLCLNNLCSIRSTKFCQEKEKASTYAYLPKSYITCRYTITYASLSFFSVVFYFYSYSAGTAHPNSSFRTLNFTVNPAVCVTLDNFFYQESIYRKALPSLCRDFIQQQREQMQDIPLGEKWLEEGTIYNNRNYENFTVSDTGFTLYFPPYQVGSYSDGSYIVEVPFISLMDCLDDKGPYAFLVQK